LLRRRFLVAGLAFATLSIATMETSYAQPARSIEVDLSSVEPASASLKAGMVETTEANWPTLLEMSDRSSVMATDLLMVSVLVQKVELARQPDGARDIAKSMAKENYGWGTKQFTCLDTLWTKESHWNYKARNPRSGAHGIAQALPATKMESISTDWRTNPLTQIQWGLSYIESRYQTPCKAYAKWKRSRYY